MDPSFIDLVGTGSNSESDLPSTAERLSHEIDKATSASAYGGGLHNKVGRTHLIGNTYSFTSHTVLFLCMITFGDHEGDTL